MDGSGSMDPVVGMEVLPGGFRLPSSLFVSGTSLPLLKWVALALLSPYASRVYWTDIRLTGESLDPLDPLALGAIPEERISVVHPRDLQRNEEEIRRIDSAAATMLRSDQPSEYLRRIAEFLRLPVHAQERISSTSSTEEPPILIASNAHLLLGHYSTEMVVSTVRAFKDSGACLVLLWGSAPPEDGPPLFDAVLRLDGTGPVRWREATLTCEKGIDSGPLGSGKPCRLRDLTLVARVLEKGIPGSCGG